MSAVTGVAAPTSWLHRRELAAYPSTGARRAYLLLVVAITVALYYELYVGGGVATLMLEHFHMSFGYFVAILAIGNLVGAFASLLAGLCDRFGRANLVVYGLLIVGLMTLLAIPNAPDKLTYGVENAIVALVEGVILVATPALIRDFSHQVGRATAMGFWTIGPVLGSLMVSLVTILTLDTFKTWESQFVICGLIGLVVFVAAFLFLRELAPALRDQIMVSLRDRALVEARAGVGRDGEPARAVPAIAASGRHRLRPRRVGAAAVLLHRGRLRDDLPRHHLPLHPVAGQRAGELELGRQRGRADRGGHAVRRAAGAQTVHAGR